MKYVNMQILEKVGCYLYCKGIGKVRTLKINLQVTFQGPTDPADMQSKPVSHIWNPNPVITFIPEEIAISNLSSN